MDYSKGIAGQRVMNAVAAGTTTQNSTAVDMAGYDSVRFTALFGTISASAVTTVKVQHGDLADGSDAVDLAGTGSVTLTPTTDNNKAISIEVVKPSKRYVRAVIVRGTGNAVIDGVWADRFSPLKQPVTDDTTVLQKKVIVSPAAGTP